MRFRQTSSRLAVPLLALLLVTAVATAHEASTGARPLVRAEYLEKLRNSIARVPEFVALRQKAAELGLRLYLFGGTAAAFAHYVRWDYLREHGDTRYQQNRFDYDFTNIFRATQDLDLVADDLDRNSGDTEHFAKLRALEEWVTANPETRYLMGSKSAWEVRSLRRNYGNKFAILDCPDFSRQHTDSHSTGTIALSATVDASSLVQDVRDWHSNYPPFLRDVLEQRLHFYYGRDHASTQRAKDGLNPPLFAAVRYLTKAAQYELRMEDRDFSTVCALISQFRTKRHLTTNYAKDWIERNGKKLYRHASDLEHAKKLLEASGLRRVLTEIRGDSATKDTLAWWMNKEPLPSFPVGRGRGKTAAHWGIDVVAHDTRDFQVYEAITRSPVGKPAVFMSRPNVAGESAYYGPGFYTREGRDGAWGTHITIRFKVNPKAVEGRDFKRVASGVLFLNAAALEVIPESLSLGPTEYFALLASGEFAQASDYGVLEKFRRRTNHRISLASPAELAGVFHYVRAALRAPTAAGNALVLREWLILPASKRFRDLLAELYADQLAAVFGADTQTAADWLSLTDGLPFRDEACFRFLTSSQEVDGQKRLQAWLKAVTAPAERAAMIRRLPTPLLYAGSKLLEMTADAVVEEMRAEILARATRDPTFATEGPLAALAAKRISNAEPPFDATQDLLRSSARWGETVRELHRWRLDRGWSDEYSRQHELVGPSADESSKASFPGMLGCLYDAQMPEDAMFQLISSFDREHARHYAKHFSHAIRHARDIDELIYWIRASNKRHSFWQERGKFAEDVSNKLDSLHASWPQRRDIVHAGSHYVTHLLPAISKRAQTFDELMALYEEPSADSSLNATVEMLLRVELPRLARLAVLSEQVVRVEGMLAKYAAYDIRNVLLGSFRRWRLDLHLGPEAKLNDLLDVFRGDSTRVWFWKDAPVDGDYLTPALLARLDDFFAGNPSPAQIFELLYGRSTHRVLRQKAVVEAYLLRALARSKAADVPALFWRPVWGNRDSWPETVTQFVHDNLDRWFDEGLTLRGFKELESRLFPTPSEAQAAQTLWVSMAKKAYARVRSAEDILQWATPQTVRGYMQTHMVVPELSQNSVEAFLSYQPTAEQIVRFVQLVHLAKFRPEDVALLGERLLQVSTKSKYLTRFVEHTRYGECHEVSAQFLENHWEQWLKLGAGTDELGWVLTMAPSVEGLRNRLVGKVSARALSKIDWLRRKYPFRGWCARKLYHLGYR